MISFDSIMKYREQYPNDNCAYLEPTDFVFVERDGECRLSNENETEETFLDRLERSKKEGKNLFFEEWTRKPKNNVIY